MREVRNVLAFVIGFVLMTFVIIHFGTSSAYNPDVQAYSKRDLLEEIK